MDHFAIKEALKDSTLAQSPKIVRLTVRCVPREGIVGVAYYPHNAGKDISRLERNKQIEAQFGFDPVTTRGTGFTQLNQVCRVRPLALVNDLIANGYVRSSSRITQRFTGSGRLTASLDIVFYKEGNVGEPLLSDAVADFLGAAYVDQVDVYANPTLEGNRVDSIVCVLGQPPKDASVETGDPGQNIRFDGLGYKVIDLQPEDEDFDERNPFNGYREPKQIELDSELGAEIPNPFAAESERVPLIAAQSIGTVSTNLGDLLKKRDGEDVH